MSKNKSVMDVLIIEDQQDVVETIEIYLENMGCFRHIVKSPDGSLGTRKLLNQKFELILLDINLPKKSGLEVLKEFGKANSMNTNSISNVVIVSGELDKSVIQAAIQMGVKHFLTKPFDESSFQEKMLKVLVGDQVVSRD